MYIFRAFLAFKLVLKTKNDPLLRYSVPGRVELLKNYLGLAVKTEIEKTAKNTKASSQSFQILDVENLDASNPDSAVLQFVLSGKPAVHKTQIAIIGGGTGGVAAAIAACSAGFSVCLVEQTSWLGGQLTAQGVSALDENYLVESTGATKRYKNFRQSVREHYKSLGATDGGARFEPYLDPGNCWVSRIAFEPKVGIKVLSDTLSPFIKSGLLRIFLRTAAVQTRIEEQKISAVQCVDLDSGKFIELQCRFCLDATELGDLIAISGIAYRTGAESRKDTAEAHAPEIANPENVQDYTYPFVIEYCKGENHCIAKPVNYDKFQAAGKFSLCGYRMFENSPFVNKAGEPAEYLPFWEYRRLIAHENFPADVFPRDLAMINWDSNDLRGQNIIDKDPRTQARRLALAKDLSLGFLYWLQTESPRDDGGKGYPEFKLRYDILDSIDGLSKFPYIRESRRIVPVRTICESDLIASVNTKARAKWFSDSLGIGHYPIDIHGTEDVPGAAQATKPFQLPASALVQKELRNLLPAAKNIGVTHITNGAYRLHPIEWAIGEAVACFAIEAIKQQTDIQRLLRNKRGLRKVQERLLEAGAPIVWFDDLLPEDKSFAAAQFLSVSGLMPVDQENLQFRPNDFLTRRELADSLQRLLRLPFSEGTFAIKDVATEDRSYNTIGAVIESGLMTLEGESFFPQRPVKASELIAISKHKLLKSSGKQSLPSNAAGELKRRDFADWLYQIARSKKFFGRH